MSQRAVCFSACAWLFGGCAGEPTDLEPVPTIEVARIGSNSLSPGAIAHSSLTTVTLDAASAAAMAGSDDARQVLRYAVRCALDSAQSVAFTTSGGFYEFSGDLAVAPGWTAGPLSASDAAWVSACVFALTNLSTTLVWISARGGNAGLATTPDELDAFQIEEGAFWGNAFTDRGPIEAFSCNGVDQIADDTRGDLPLRACAQPDGASSGLSPCGMSYAGPCSQVCAGIATYANCAFPGRSPVAEVITTMLHGEALPLELGPRH